MSAASRESPRGDTERHSPSQNVVVPVAQRSQAPHPTPDEPGELSGGASSQRTTRQSDLAPSLAAWDTRTHSPDAPSSHPAAPIEPSAPADFKPFFALVEDPLTGEYHHPEVHYVFSDDEDQGVLTSAALRAIDDEDLTLQERDGVEERAAVIDMDYDGRTVLGISSLCPEWQGLSCQVWAAPGRSGSASENRRVGAGNSHADKGLMLRVSGKEASRGIAAAAGNQNSGDVDGLVKRFGSALEDLDEVLGEEAKAQQDESSNVIRTQRPGSRTE